MMVKIFLSKCMVEKCKQTAGKLLNLKKQEIMFTKDLIKELVYIDEVLRQEQYNGRDLSECIGSFFKIINKLISNIDILMEEVLSPHLSECRDSAVFIRDHLDFLLNLRKICEELQEKHTAHCFCLAKRCKEVH